MKRRALMTFATLGLLAALTATSTLAQSDLFLKVTIPFEFSARGKLLPAGKYTVRRGPQGALVIQSVENHACQIFNTYPFQRNMTRDESSLVFNRYGNQYFLSTIWMAGADVGLTTFKSRAEERLILVQRPTAKSASRQTVSINADR